MKLKSTPAPAAVQEAQTPRWEMAHREVNIRNANDRAYLDGVIQMGQGDAAKYWEHYENIGEVRYALERAAKVAGYCQFGAAYEGDRGEVTRTHRDSPTVRRIVNEISSRFGGVRGLVERYYVLMKIPGEALFIQFRAEMPDGYWFLSPDEVDRTELMSDDVKNLTRPLTWKTARSAKVGVRQGNPFELKVQPDDVLGRVWNPSRRFVDEVNSPMGAVEPLCEMLTDLTNSIKDRIRSRFASNGMLLLPSSMNEAAIGGPQPDRLLYSQNKVLNAIIHILTTNMARYGGAAVDRLPIAIMGDADDLEKVRHMIFDTKIDEVDLKLRVELIGRILEGLDQQKSATRDGSDQNHWGAWATEESERRITVEPDLQQLDHLLTRMVLWRELLKEGWDSARIRPWTITHELNEAMVRVNQAEDFRQAYDRYGIGPKALRRATGAKETDAPTVDEQMRMLGFKMGNPILAYYGIEGVTVHLEEASAWGKTKPGPEGQSGGDPTPVGPGTGNPGSPNDRDSNTPKAQEPDA